MFFFARLPGVRSFTCPTRSGGGGSICVDCRMNVLPSETAHFGNKVYINRVQWCIFFPFAIYTAVCLSSAFSTLWHIVRHCGPLRSVGVFFSTSWMNWASETGSKLLRSPWTAKLNGQCSSPSAVLWGNWIWLGLGWSPVIWQLPNKNISLDAAVKTSTMLR